MGSIEINEQLAALVHKRRQVALAHAQDEPIVNGYVLVGELISKADDLRCLINLSEQISFSLGELAECFADNGEPPLN